MKKILLTGATSGIGLVALKEYAKDANNYIYIIARNEEKAKKIIDEIGTYNIELIVHDLEDVAGIKAVLDKALGKGCHIDSFIHCAGIAGYFRFKSVTYDVALKYMNVNYFSFQEIVRLISLYKKKEETQAIVGISSIACKVFSDLLVHYAISKVAIECMCKILSEDFLEKNIKINCICPGFVKTNMVVVPVDDDEAENYVKESMGQKMGFITPEYIFEEIKRLADFDKCKTTGTVVTVNAGLISW